MSYNKDLKVAINELIGEEKYEKIINQENSHLGLKHRYKTRCNR